MAQQKYPVPIAQSRAVEQNGTPAREWYAYWQGIQEVATRLDGIDALSGSVSNDDLRDKINEILTAFKTVD